MEYISTRGQSAGLNFEEVLLAGLACDGGLYVPKSWPRLSADEFRKMRGWSYSEVAFGVMRLFVGGVIDDVSLRRIVEEAYGEFRHQCVAPLVEIGANEWVMELFHGPTLAFKDVAMQVLGRLYDHVLATRDRHITIVGATSGDTGSAAIEAIRGRDRAAIFIMHPKGRTSEVQRRQMTTVSPSDSPNVHNIAIEGTFDDCQALLKRMFHDEGFREAISLSGVNSINWARIVPQAVYYITAALRLGGPDRSVAFSVPTGNFGDIFAGYVAMQMGLPIERLIIASNSNDILTRVMQTREHKLNGVVATMSPSMDIQVSSNFERLLFDMYGRDSEAVCGLMGELAKTGRFKISQEALDRVSDVFSAACVDEDQTSAMMAQVYRETDGYLIDPHTAVGVAAARRGLVGSDVPRVTLSTAHPAKFPEAVAQATGVHPPLPSHMANLFDREEYYDVLPNDLDAVQQYIRERVK